jgi:hypothetical protein
VDEARNYLRVCHDRLEEAKKRIEVRPESAAGGGQTAEGTGTLL